VPYLYDTHDSPRESGTFHIAFLPGRNAPPVPGAPADRVEGSRMSLNSVELFLHFRRICAEHCMCKLLYHLIVCVY
jgi:hypothetical protein